MLKTVLLLLSSLSLVACGGGQSREVPDATPGGSADAARASGDIEVVQSDRALASGTGQFDFGTIPVGLGRVRYDFEIRNLGDGELAIESIAVTGADAAAFAMEGAAPATVPAGGTTGFSVTFAPTSTGAKNALLVIANDDPDEARYEVGFSGVGADAGDLDPDTDGDWDADEYVGYDTVEARIVVRVGDIDNLGFGWPVDFDPFSGASTPSHSFPWQPEAEDPPGTDRVMVVSSYNGAPPAGQDGYTSSTSRPDNLPQAVSMSFDLRGSVPTSAVLQIFVDDFQAPVWQADYQVTLDGMRAPFIEDVVNSLVQTGPIGKLITLTVPVEFVELLADGELEILIDDPVTGAGDGFALDFVKLFIDVYGFKNTGTISGAVSEAGSGTPLDGVEVTASGYVTATTDGSGAYSLAGVPAGFVYLRANKAGYQPHEQLVDLATDEIKVINVSLTPQ